MVAAIWKTVSYRERAAELALLTRTRVQMKRKLCVIHNHVEGLLEQGGIKLLTTGEDLRNTYPG